MEFKKSPVVFNEDDHSYFLGEKRLIGITGLIHSVLGLGVYPDASDYVKGYSIPRAGSIGTAVHHAIQTYDETGLKMYEQKVNTRYFQGTAAERVDMEVWNVANQLETYIEHQSFYGFEPLANELTVSDNKRYASQIDNVWLHKETKAIWLVDTKTNNLDYYPLCGYFNPKYFDDRLDALLEYLSWQLSVYAELFEAENPGMKVAGLACNWLRPDIGRFYIVERKPSNLVWELLKAEWEIVDGSVVYFHPDPSVFGIVDNLPEKAPETLPVVPQDVVDYVSSLIAEEKALKSKLEEAKQGLRAAMEAHGIKTFDFGPFKATIAADSERVTFDSTRFKKECPEVYAQYSVRKTTKGGLTLKSKEQ